jgi:hypothetical protein
VTYVLVFIATFLADVAWTMYFKEVAKERAARSAAWSSAIVLLGGYTVIEYVNTPNILWATVTGSFAGTYVTMKWDTILKWVTQE